MNQNLTLRACFMLIVLFQAPSFAAERPTKRQKVALSELQEVIAISEQITAYGKKRADRTKLYPSMNFTLSAVELEKQRQPLVEKLTDEEYVQYLHYRFPGKVFEGDRLSHSLLDEPRKKLVQTVLPVVIANMVASYAACAWRNPNITTVRYMGTPTHFIAYSCDMPRGERGEMIVLSTSCRKDFEAGASLFHIVPQQQLQERLSLHKYIWEKPSEKDLENLAASKRYSQETLLLLKKGTFFDAPS